MLVKTAKVSAVAKIRVLMDTPPVLFMRDDSTKKTWTFDPEKLIVATDADNAGEKYPADFVYKGKLVDF